MLTLEKIDKILDRIDNLNDKYLDKRYELTKPGFKIPDKQPKIKRLYKKIYNLKIKKSNK